MIRSLLTLAVLVTAGCASQAIEVAPDDDDYALGWSENAAEVYFYSPSGALVSPFYGSEQFSRDAVVGLPGYLFTKRGSVLMHPGERWIHFQCPEPASIEVSHWWPGVKYSFLAGHSYDVRCEKSQPVVHERTPGA